MYACKHVENRWLLPVQPWNQAVMNASRHCQLAIVRFMAHLWRCQWKLLIVPCPLMPYRLWPSFCGVYFASALWRLLPPSGRRRSLRQNSPQRLPVVKPWQRRRPSASPRPRAPYCETDVVMKVYVRICEVFWTRTVLLISTNHIQMIVQRWV